MTLHKLSRTLHPHLLTLQKELVAEWKKPSPGRYAEPIIYEVDPGGNEPIHLYVVWKKWEGVNPTDRSDVILDAFESVRGKKQVVRVALANGLTPDEARGIGLEQLEEKREETGDVRKRSPRSTKSR
jgi:hypothetical protein